MSVVWRKIWRDLASNRARTAMVVASIAVSIAALGLVFSLNQTMGARLTAAHRETAPAHVTVRGGPFDAEAIEAIEHERGVRRAQGEIAVPIRWHVAERMAEASRRAGPAWQEGVLIARAEYESQKMDLLQLVDGTWPGDRLPRTHLQTLALDSLSVDHFGAPVGTEIVIDGGERASRASIQGVVYVPDVLSPAWGGSATFYASPETAARLTSHASAEHFNRLQIRLESYSVASAERAAEQVEDRLERMGLTVDGYTVTDPHEHPMQEQVDAVLIVLGVIGGLSLGLSGFLIVNVVNAILARQVRQIGAMKAVGATLIDIAWIYLAMTLIYGGLALFLAVPVGILGAHLVGSWLLSMFNVAAAGLQINPLAVVIQSVVGLFVPPFAALMPVLKVARTTVRQAISDYGLDGRFGRSWADRAVVRMRGLPRSLALSLRNVFRRKGRLILTLTMLAFSGAVFITVTSTQAALERTFQVIFELEGDVAISLNHPQPASRLIGLAQDLPTVQRAEVWHETMAAARRWTDCRTDRTVPSGNTPSTGQGRRCSLRLEDGDPFSLLVTGVPGDTTMFHPRIIDGRGLQPGEGRSLLVNNRLVVEEGVEIGDVLRLEIDGEPSNWTVVGSYLSLNVLQDVCYAPAEALARETNTRGEGTLLKAVTHVDGVQAESEVIDALTASLEDQNIEVDGSFSAAQQYRESQSAFSVLIYLLLTMAVLVGLVGSIGLLSTMSINVVERTREIGVMRAIGATTPTVVRVFVAEGVFVGLLSWLLAVPVSVPGAFAMSAVVGGAIVQIPLDAAYSLWGALLWLVIVVVLSAGASFWPALRAARVSVRQSLSYE